MLGEMTVVFSEAILIPDNYEKFNDKILQITLDPGDNIPKKFTWYVTMCTSTMMTIFINFTDPMLIS